MVIGYVRHYFPIALLQPETVLAKTLEIFTFRLAGKISSSISVQSLHTNDHIRKNSGIEFTQARQDIITLDCDLEMS